MTTEPKRAGRPPTPPDQALTQRSVRMTQSQWAKFERCGGQPWLRELVEKAKEAKSEK